MSQVIVYQEGNEPLRVVCPAGEYTVEDCLPSIPPMCEYLIIDDSQLTLDPYFRDAWQLRGSVLSVNVEKANEIHKQNLRKLRASRLQKLDVDYMRAHESNDTETMAIVTQQKQALRDITEFPLIEDLDVLKKHGFYPFS
jgi:hypothetical protein